MAKRKCKDCPVKRPSPKAAAFKDLAGTRSSVASLYMSTEATNSAHRAAVGQLERTVVAVRGFCVFWTVLAVLGLLLASCRVLG